MSTAFFDIGAALDTHMGTMTSVPPIAWENKEFNPTGKTLYIRPTHLPGETVPETLGEANGRDLNVGIYQVDIFAEAGKGKKDAINMADTIATRFKHGTKLTYNGVTVQIKHVNINPATNSKNGWYQLFVEIVYYSFTARR